MDVNSQADKSNQELDVTNLIGISSLESHDFGQLPRLSALESLGKISDKNQKAMECLAGLALGSTSNTTPIKIRLRALELLGRSLEAHRQEEISDSIKQTALTAAVGALADPALLMRQSALKILEPVILKPQVYIKVCQFLVPPATFDRKLRVNFEVRVAAAKTLSRAIQIPYVRDTFVQALNKPEPNYEVRLPLLAGLSTLLSNQNYPLRQDDSKAVCCLLTRGDSTGAVQNEINFSNRIFKRTNLARYEEALNLSKIRVATDLQDILQTQPLAHFIYQHAGHLLKNYERAPLIDTTKIWPMHNRYFFYEGEIRKIWAEHGVDSQTRKIMEQAIKEELTQYIKELESGNDCETKLLADFLALFVWTNDRGFHSEVIKIKPFLEKLNPELKCSEGFTIKELFNFYEVSYQHHELKKKREDVGFLLREKTRHFDIAIANTTNRKDELRERLAIFQEAVDLKIVTSEAMTRLAKGLVTFFERDHRGYFEILHEVKDTYPKITHLLTLVIERAPISTHTRGFDELSLKVLGGDTADLHEATEARDVVVKNIKIMLEKEYILKRIEFASSTLHYRFFRTPQGIQNFRHELIDFETALEHKLIGETQLLQLGSMLDLLFVETEKKFDFLKEVKILTSTLPRPLVGLLLHAACEYAPHLRNRYSFKELTAAFDGRDAG